MTKRDLPKEDIGAFLRHNPPFLYTKEWFYKHRLSRRWYKLADDKEIHDTCITQAHVKENPYTHACYQTLTFDYFAKKEDY